MGMTQAKAPVARYLSVSRSSQSAIWSLSPFFLTSHR